MKEDILKIRIFRIGIIFMFCLSSLLCQAKKSTNIVDGFLPDFTMILTPKHETCNNNGNITVNLSSLTNGATIDIALFFGTSTTPIYTSTQVVSSDTYTWVSGALSAGIYRVEVIQSFNGETNSQIANTTIQDKKASIVANLTTTNNCNKFTIKANVTAGNPVSYWLLDIATNTIIRPEQASNIFTNVDPGKYRVYIKDECEEIRTYDTVQLTAVNFKPIINTYIFYGKLTSCNTMQVSNYFSGNLAYPIHVKYTATDGTNTTVVEGDFNTSSVMMEIPTYFGGNLKIEATDACGNVADVVNSTIDSPRTSTQDIPAGCGKVNQQIFYSLLSGNKTLEFTNFPAGFDPNYNTHYIPAGNIPFTFNGTTWKGIFVFSDSTGEINNGSIMMGTTANPLPEGFYNYKITDECGKTVTSFFSISNQTLKVRQRYSRTGCALGNGGSQFWITSPFSYAPNANITSVVIKSAPASFPYPFPYTVPSSSISSGKWNFLNAPAGTYVADVTTDCKVFTDYSFSITGRVVTQKSITATPGCNAFSIQYSYTGNTSYNAFYIQKYYPASGRWGHPSTGSLSSDVGYKISNPLTAADMVSNNIYTQTNNTPSTVDGDGPGNIVNLTGYYNGTTEGLYRVIIKYIDVDGQPCYDLIGEYTYNYAPKVNNYYVFQCSNGKMNIAIDAQGVQPLQYKIISKDGDTSFILDNATNPVFSNLDTAVYWIEIKDNCGNVFKVTASAVTTKLPAIKPSNLCEGQNGKLYIDGLSFMTITWSKEGSSTVYPTGNSVNFTPFTSANDSGIYYATLTYTGDTTNCINEKLTYTIPASSSSPNAGVGQTVTINKNTISGVLNLFDYITAPYDNYGTFTALSPSPNAYLTGSSFDGKNAPKGTYKFTYTVNGSCTGVASTIITINLTGSCTQPAASGDAVTGKIFGISTVSARPENWPKDVKNAHIALLSKNKGFVLTRTTSASISNPQKGMLIWDTYDKCIKLYNGTIWRCIEQSCNQ